MKLDPQDPRLTGYALGELDETERAAIAAALADSPECRCVVDEIRGTAGLLTTALQAEPCPELSQQHHEQIEAALAPSRQAPRERWRFPHLFAWPPRLATAGIWATACVLAVGGCYLFLRAFNASTGPQAHSLMTVKFDPRPGQPAPPPPPSPQAPVNVANLLAPLPQIAVNPPVTNAFLGAANGTWTYSGALANWGYVLSNGSVAVAQANDTTFAGVTMPSGNRITAPPGSASADSRYLRNDALNISLVGGGVITGSGGIAKNGAGTLVLNAKNTYTGGTVINAGALQINTGPDTGGYAVSPMSSFGQPVSCQPSIVRSYYNPSYETESYDRVVDNLFLAVQENALSTFSIDVDTASYANVRRFLNDGRLPPRDAVRIEEMVNYFTYDYPPPKDGRPFSVNVEVAACPWNAEHRLVRIGLKGKTVAPARRPPCNLVFLIDVSGSMGDANKLSLIKPAMRMLVERLTENERVAIVVYADSARVALPSTSGDRKQVILDAIDALQSGGCTNGGDGIRWAYRIAQENFIERGVNRVILCTDGDFNVGVTNQGDLVRMIEQKAKSGVFLSVLGFGMGNLKDSTMEKLADKGNGNYAYIDTLNEAHKVLVAQMNGTLVTIAKDVKIQVEFNPAQASAYRLIGYENRLLRTQDFANDKKDAGEIGAGHTVTALYEVVPAQNEMPLVSMAPLKYQPKMEPAVKRRPQNVPETVSNELLTVKLRYKAPDGDKSQLIERAVTDTGASYARASGDFKFAAAVAAFGMLLRDSEHKGVASYNGVIELAGEGRGADDGGYRAEFVSLVKRAKAIAGK